MTDSREKSKTSTASSESFELTDDEKTIAQIRKKIHDTKSIHDLQQLKSLHLGKNSLLAKKMADLKNIKCDDERKKQGHVLTTMYQAINQCINDHWKNLKDSVWKEYVQKQNTDITLESRDYKLGTMHPIRAMCFRVNRILQSMGFRFVDAPYVEDIFYNFDALNIPFNHPARQEMCTFYLESDDQTVLRTHATNTQIHWLEKHKQPCKIFNTGQVFRNDSDKTHNPVFHQNDILVMGPDVTMEDLFSTVHIFLSRALREIRDLRIRIRPSHFPFTEPSGEVDVWVDGRWLEVLGCGMMHPNVFRTLNIDPERMRGYAWGMGVDRLAMITYGFTDLRQAFDSDYRWTKNFGISTFGV